MPSILQEWVCDLPYMQQSVLMTAIRGADGTSKENAAKDVVQFLRRCVFYSALGVILDPFNDQGLDVPGTFMQARAADEVMRSMDELLSDHDALPHHFIMHLIHAAEILGYKHPNGAVQRLWRILYTGFCDSMHMAPETCGQMDDRLKDKLLDGQ